MVTLELLNKACEVFNRRTELFKAGNDWAEFNRLTDECNALLVQMGKEPYLTKSKRVP